ncbi:UNVERIFIED_CONTAM: hypothetical protein Slati_0419800 [Sesamum latifolium]|uniref:Uncharacterized protein n=1 Tax=Sesamum latifolium TaxID=2727402 RepID=A0AAW2XVW0_9LAMI
MNRRGRASQMIDLIDFQQEWLNDVVPNQLKPGVPEMVHDVLLSPREEIINYDHAIASFDKPVNQMTPHKPCPTRYHNPETLPFQSKRNFPNRVESEPVYQVAVLVYGSVRLSQLGGEVRVADRRGELEEGRRTKTRVAIAMPTNRKRSRCSRSM